MLSEFRSRAYRIASVAAVCVCVVVGCRPSHPLVSSPVLASRNAERSVFTDAALFRKLCMEADSGLGPAARRCTPRDQRVQIR
jgi:hypothetical protein